MHHLGENGWSWPEGHWGQSNNVVVPGASYSVCICTIFPFNVILQTYNHGILQVCPVWQGLGASTKVHGFIVRQCIKNWFETRVDMKNMDYLLTFLYALWAEMITCRSFHFPLFLFFFFFGLQLSSSRLSIIMKTEEDEVDNWICIITEFELYCGCYSELIL